MALTINTRTLLNGWSGRYGGVPPFDRVSVGALSKALQTAMDEQLAELQVIANNPQPPTFVNTIEAFENSGRALDRVMTIYHVYSSTMSDDAMQAVERDMEPKLAAFHDAITQNSALFARIRAVYEKRDSNNLGAEQKRLCWLHYQHFARTGAQLDDAAKKTLSDINQRLASLYTEFSQNVLKDENDIQLVLDDERQLAGLPQAERDAAATEAVTRGLKGKWVIANTRSSVEPFLTYSVRRELREQVWRNFVSRGDHGATDNKTIAGQILMLRKKRARLLGHETFAHWQLEDTMAKHPDKAVQLMRSMWQPAVQRVQQEVADMQKFADKDGIKIAAWDYRYYAEQVRKARYDLDANLLKPYLQLDKLREGMFFVAQQLFGLQFTSISVPVYHPDVSVYEVRNHQDEHVGLWYFDPYARRGKQSGAWMSEYRRQEKFAGNVSAIVSNNANFIKGKSGEPVLINWDDAVTLFHEFGHALHGLLSNVRYPSLSGTSVTRDFVEFPSQLLEHWLLTPEVLNRFALHYQTGEAIPQTLVDKIKQARNFNQGFATLEFLASALVDMELHLADNDVIDVAQFETESLQSLGMPAEVVMRHRIPHFGHVFSGDGYAAGYYSYLWADTLVADAWEAFVESGDVFDQALATRLRDHVFSAGNQQEPEMAYRAFRGRDADVQALMRKRGFV